MNKKTQATVTGANPANNSTPHQLLKGSIDLIRTTIGLCALAITVSFAACSASTSTPIATFPPTTSAPIPTFTPVATTVQQQTATPTSLDPCLLVTS
jgi:hypothetical protein